MNVTAEIGAAPQYMLALERANEVRLARAQLKRGVAAGEVSAAEVVLECPWESESMRLCELLMSQRRWGRTRCRKLLQSIGLAENKALGSLTQRQRITLAALVAEKAGAASKASERNRAAREPARRNGSQPADRKSRTKLAVH